jgi:hypothetical protein
LFEIVRRSLCEALHLSRIQALFRKAFTKFLDLNNLVIVRNMTSSDIFEQSFPLAQLSALVEPMSITMLAARWAALMATRSIGLGGQRWGVEYSVTRGLFCEPLLGPEPRDFQEA